MVHPPGARPLEDAERAGIRLDVVMLYREGMRLALEAADAVSEDGQLAHVGVFADPSELERLRTVAPATHSRIVTDNERALIFDDPFGVRWELNTFDYEDPPGMSHGVRSGRWLELPSRKRGQHPQQQA